MPRIILDWDGVFYAALRLHPNRVEGFVLETIDNAFDAGATQVDWSYLSGQNKLVIEDDGEGMDWRAQKEFFTPFGSTRRGDPRFKGRGQFGIGKALVLSAGQSVLVETVCSTGSAGLAWSRNHPNNYDEDRPCSLTHRGTRITISGISAEIRDGLIRNFDDYVRIHYLSELSKITFNGKPIESVALGHPQSTRRIRIEVGESRYGGTLRLWWSKEELPPHLQGIGVIIGRSVGIREKLDKNWSEWSHISGEAHDVDFLREKITLDKTRFIEDPLVDAFRSELTRIVGDFRLRHLGTSAAVRVKEWKGMSRELADIFRAINAEILSQLGGTPAPSALFGGVSESDERKEPGPRGRGREDKERPHGLRVVVQEFEGVPDNLARMEKDRVVVWSNHPAYLALHPSASLSESTDVGVRYHVGIAVFMEYVRSGKLAKQVTTPGEYADVLTTFLTHWGKKRGAGLRKD